MILRSDCLIRSIRAIIALTLCICLIPSSAFADDPKVESKLGFTEFLTTFAQIIEECQENVVKEIEKKVEDHKFEVIVERAYAECGKPYVWGACGPSSYDCSGLVGYCITGEYSRIGTTYTFMGWPQIAEPRPGDVCVNNGHCGIYIGNGQMIHAPQSGDVVKVGPVQSGMIYVRYPNL